MNLDSWYVDITVLNASVANKYNQSTYTSSTIQGRLVIRYSEVILKDGEIIKSKAKLYTLSDISLDSKITEDYKFKIYSKKACKNKEGNLMFYSYELI